jgi:YD repeat-containing protein
MIARKCSQAFAICVLACICCVGSAESQSCLHEPVGNACYKIFGFTLGQTYKPKGSTCYCGPAAPLQETDCWVPQCSEHACCSDHTPTPSAGRPINLATGNTFIAQQDVRIPGLGNGLTLVRTWNSSLRASLYPGIGLFGQNWRSTYEEWIYVDDDNTVAYARGDGIVWNFVYSSGQTFAPVAPANLVAGLFQGPTTWTLTFQNGERRVFDATSGRLLSIADRNGNTTQLTYDASFRLTTVTDPASRHLYFSYASPTSFLVTSVTSDVGISLSYSYDSQSRLIYYTKPDNTILSFQYNSPSPSLITAVLDQNGKILEAHTYDNQGRGLTSSRAGGVEAVTITYPYGTLVLP